MSCQVQITAIIYDKRGRILSAGKNSFIKTHPLQAKWCKKAKQDSHKVYLHAEVDAIVKCHNLDKAYKIVVFRYGKEGKPLNAKPCPSCQMAIQSVGITRVEHT